MERERGAQGKEVAYRRTSQRGDVSLKREEKGAITFNGKPARPA